MGTTLVVADGDTLIEVDLAGLMVDVDEPLVAGLEGPADALARPLLETTTQLAGAIFEVANFAEFKDRVKRLEKAPTCVDLIHDYVTYNCEARSLETLMHGLAQADRPGEIDL